MEEHLIHHISQISSPEAGTLLESVPALGGKISQAVERIISETKKEIPRPSQTPLHFNIQYE